MSIGLLSVVVISAFAAPASEWTLLIPEAPDVEAGVLSGVWTREGDMLVGRADPGEVGWWRVPGTYWDFDLEVEFRTPTPANGGVQYRGHWLPLHPESGPEPFGMFGYQANIETGEPGKTGEILIRHGEPPLSGASEQADQALKPEGWNALRIETRGPVSRVYLNGVPAATVYDETMIGGFIALQVQPSAEEPAEVQYRNLRVRDLGRTGVWRSLFDGQTLRGWKNWGSERWSVEDGVIQGRRGPKESEGYLATEERWNDFRVRGEFRMRGSGNYGLFYHSTITLRDDGYPVIAGVQGEVEPDYPGDTGWLYESYRRGWLVPPNQKSVQAYLLKPGEWNAIEIRSMGNRITTWVNGYRVIEWTDPSPQLFEGSFALQLHTGEGAGIDWRALYVTYP